MKKFLFKTLLFVLLVITIFVIGILLPPTQRGKQNWLFAKIHKDSLLRNITTPRIIFIGGSNVTLGLNSNLVKDSLGLYPINTAIHASLGLLYMIDEVLPYIRPGDIVVVSPEYSQFYGDLAYGSNELVRTVFDVDFSEITTIRKEQWMNIFKLIPKYSLSKYNPWEYFNNKEKPIYGRHSFNKYGDGDDHWHMKKKKVKTYETISEDFNYFVVDQLYDFNEKVNKKAATLFISFPGFQQSSFENSRNQIMKVDDELKKKGFTLLGSPQRYEISDSLFFDSPYHLIKEGVDYRTNLLIADLKEHIPKSFAGY